MPRRRIPTLTFLPPNPDGSYGDQCATRLLDSVTNRTWVYRLNKISILLFIELHLIASFLFNYHSDYPKKVAELGRV